MLQEKPAINNKRSDYNIPAQFKEFQQLTYTIYIEKGVCLFILKPKSVDLLKSRCQVEEEKS